MKAKIFRLSYNFLIRIKVPPLLIRHSFAQGSGLFACIRDLPLVTEYKITGFFSRIAALQLRVISPRKR